jgi:CubicO group peptidase (beta-lactamase class C family)
LLEKEGKLSLDDPLQKHVPELPAYGAPLTIRHVLHHTSGLREWRLLAALGGAPEGTRVYQNADILALAVRQQGLNFDPGTHYSYSNTGFNIAPILIERVLGDGRSFPRFTREAIFAPLGMTHTRWRDNFREVIPGRALAYGPAADGWVSQTPIENIVGAGGMLTTVGDLLLWNGNFTHTRVGGRQVIERMQTPARLSSGQETEYGTGLGVTRHRGLREVSHSGATGGYRTWLGRYPEKDVSVAVLCNSASADAVALGRETAGIWTGLNTPPPDRAPLTEAEAQPLLGTYYSPGDHQTRKLEMRHGNAMFGPARLFRGEKGKIHLGAASASSIEPMGDRPARLRQHSPSRDFTWERVEPYHPTTAQLAEFAGRYTSPEAAEPILVALASTGKVTLQIGSAPAAGRASLLLDPVYRDGFTTASGLAIRFLRDAGGRVNGLGVGDARTWDVRFAKQAQ